MILAPILLAASLGQTCVAPSSRAGPPPCAAVNVEGCLPGYERELDAWGRVVYRCDRYVYTPPQATPEPSPRFAPSPRVAPAPPPYAEPYAAPPPPRWGRPAYAPPASAWRRGLAALVLLPGGTDIGRRRDTDGALNLGLELRGESGGGRLRFGYEYSRPASLLDISFKYDFLDGPISPFLALGVGVASLDPELMGLPSLDERVWRATGSLSGGVDLFLTPNLFASVELKARAFARDEALESSATHATSFFFGLGLYL